MTVTDPVVGELWRRGFRSNERNWKGKIAGKIGIWSLNGWMNFWWSWIGTVAFYCKAKQAFNWLKHPSYCLGNVLPSISLGRAGFESLNWLRLFQFRIAINLFLLGVRLFLIMCNTLPSSFSVSYGYLTIHIPKNPKKRPEKAEKEYFWNLLVRASIVRTKLTAPTVTVVVSFFSLRENWIAVVCPRKKIEMNENWFRLRRPQLRLGSW